MQGLRKKVVPVERHKIRLSSDAKKLDAYLQSYNRCKRRKKVLEDRRQQILLDFQSPLKNIKFDGMPRRKGMTGEGSAVLPLQLDEIDMRIKEKIEDAKKEYIKLNEVLEFLELNEEGRIILEYRYIDSLKWWEIEKMEHRSKTTLVYIWRKALYSLLEFPKIRQIISGNRNKY